MTSLTSSSLSPQGGERARVRGILRGILSILFGAVMPIAFLFADPGFFRPGVFDVAFSGEYRAFFYTAALFAALLVVHATLRAARSRIEAGLLYGAAVVATALGVIMLPLAIIGIRYGYGPLGFSPFVAAWVYLRSGLRAHAPQRVSGAAAAGALAFLLVPLAAQTAVNATVDLAVAHPGQSAQRVLAAARIVFDPEQLVGRYQATPTAEEKHRLSTAYRAMTGKSIEERLAD